MLLYTIGGVVDMKFDKLFAQKKDDNNYSLPFYGVRGSIKKVSLDGDYLLVTRYGASGEDGEKLPTPMNKRKELQKNLIDDLKKYLEINESKYFTSLSNQSKKCFSKKKVIILAIVSSLITVLSLLGFVLIPNNLSYAFLSAFFVSFIASCHELSELKELYDEEKRQKFIHQYEDYYNKINLYNIHKDKEKQRKSTKNADFSRNSSDKVIDINKKKILEKKGA